MNIALVDSPLIDKSNCNVLRVNCSIGAEKNSSGLNSDLNEALKWWNSETFKPKSKRGCKNSPLTLIKSIETLFPAFLKWVS